MTDDIEARAREMNERREVVIRNAVRNLSPVIEQAIRAAVCSVGAAALRAAHTQGMLDAASAIHDLDPLLAEHIRALAKPKEAGDA